MRKILLVLLTSMLFFNIVSALDLGTGVYQFIGNSVALENYLDEFTGSEVELNQLLENGCASYVQTRFPSYYSLGETRYHSSYYSSIDATKFYCKVDKAMEWRGQVYNGTMTFWQGTYKLVDGEWDIVTRKSHFSSAYPYFAFPAINACMINE